MQLTLASVALVNVAYLQPNVESKDEIELATEIVNVAKQSTKIFCNFYFGLIKKKRILLSVCVRLKWIFLPALVVTGNVELHSVDQHRLGNFVVVVAVLVEEQLLYHFVLAAEPIRFEN